MVVSYIVRVLVYFLGYLFIAFGVAFSINSNLGISPGNSLPFVINSVFALNNLGLIVTLFFIFVIILQIIILGKKFKLINLLQIGFSFIFGYLVDLTVLIIGDFTIPTYFGQLTMLFISIILIAIGVVIYIDAKIMPMPAEGLSLALCEKFNLKFHNAKLVFDISVVVLAVALSLIATGKINGVREGTVISALLVGICVKYIKILKAKIIQSFVKEKNKNSL